MPLEQRQIARYLMSGLDSREFLVKLGIRILGRLPYHYVVEFPKGWTAKERTDHVLEIKDGNGVLRILSYPEHGGEAPLLEIVHP